MDEDVIVQTGTQFPTMIYVFIAILVVAAIIYAIYKIKKLFTRPEMYGLTREEIQERWQQIRNTSQQGVMGAKLAIMEADTLLDSALKSMSMPGATLGERLKVAGYQYPKLRNVWWAHKLRNQLVHEATFQIGQRQASQAIDEYERALKILHLL
jgi:hypothetical protein